MPHFFEHDDTIRCYHCGNIVPMKLVGRDISTWDEGDGYYGVEEWSFYMCPTCKEPTLLCYYWQQKDGSITSKVGRSIAFPNNLFDDKSVPEIIRRALQAASETKSVDVAISLIAWRRVIELICKDLNAEGRNLYERITDLSSKNVFPSTINDASHLIRMLGNEGAHSESETISRTSIYGIESLVKNIIEYVYILPQKVREISSSHDAIVNP